MAFDSNPSGTLHFQTFGTKNELVNWANSSEGTEYIISINYDSINNNWVIFYIIE